MRLIISLMVLIGVVVVACNSKEVISYPKLTDYYPLQVGKTFTYKLDSTVRVNFGAALTVHSYLAKDTVESQFNDAQGRPSFRIFRYLRDVAQTQPWKYTATYVATFDNTNQRVEYVDNNLRYVVLQEPVNEGFSWNGNSFIDTKGANSLVGYLDEWHYTYQDVGMPYTVAKGKFDTTIAVLQANDFPADPNNFSFYQQTDYSIEVYAKGVGLIYKEFLHKTWDINPPPAHWTDESYGVKLNLVDYK
jgi:hypothetical protein